MGRSPFGREVEQDQRMPVKFVPHLRKKRLAQALYMNLAGFAQALGVPAFRRCISSTAVLMMLAKP